MPKIKGELGSFIGQPKIEINCEYCKGKFLDYISNHRRFCSRKCSDLWKKVVYKGKNNPFYGKYHTEETLKKLIGRKLSEEHKQHLKDNNWSKKDGFISPSKGKVGKLNPLFGRKRPKDLMERIRKINTKKLDLDYIKYSYTKEKKTCKEIGKELGVSSYTIWKRLKVLGIPIKKRVTEITKQKIRENRAKQILPIKNTSIEIKIQNFLRLLHIEFMAHCYISKMTNKYQCDVFIPSIKTIIEADGCYFHGCPLCRYQINKKVLEQIERDKIRTKELEEKVYRIIRLWEHEINKMNINDFERRLNK